MKLYSYWRSTTSLRLRAALNLKGLAHEIVPVDLVAGDQRSEAYRAVNPGQGVPALVLDDGTVLTQSMAILDYLETVHPQPPLLPQDPVARAHVKAAADQIALDIHPVNNLKVINRLRSMGHSQDEAVAWMNHWMTEGFTAFQALIRADTPFCFSDAPGLADLCLVGQLYNARRWGCDLAPFARLVEIDRRCQGIDAIARAMPEAQPDAT
ncbi:MAG: maleylacetoacetate isomerase [Rhodobacteraceae bacterium]|nr:MAG: maleylacetoacetate isomerase [Paracoccaceae bacterium]